MILEIFIRASKIYQTDSILNLYDSYLRDIAMEFNGLWEQLA